MSIRAVLGIIRAEFCLVLFNMIKSLNVAMRHVAKVTELTSFSFLILAEICRVYSILAPSIYFRVEILAHFVLMNSTLTAFYNFKHSEF